MSAARRKPCAAHRAPPGLPDAARQAGETAEHWVRQQIDALRRAAMACGEASGFSTPEAWAGVAAFSSGASKAPQGQPAVRPAPHLARAAVADAVAPVAAHGDARRNTVRPKLFLQSGRSIAAGEPAWLRVEEPRFAPMPCGAAALDGRPEGDVVQLTLSVLRCTDQVAAETRTIRGSEFSVGRGPGVDRVLPDPAWLLFHGHFAATYRGRARQIADICTNGSAMNRDAVPIGHSDAGTRHAGNRRQPGAYEIEVRLHEDAPHAAFGVPAIAAQVPHDFGPLAPEPGNSSLVGPTKADHVQLLENALLPDDLDKDPREGIKPPSAAAAPEVPQPAARPVPQPVLQPMGQPLVQAVVVPVVPPHAAVRTPLECLNPTTRRAQAEHGGGFSLLAAQPNARARDPYEALDPRTVQALSDHFKRVFGKAFARASGQALGETSARHRG